MEPIDDVVRGVMVAVITVVALVIAGGTAAFAVLFRRRGDRGIPSGSGAGNTSIASLRRQASALLVRLDDTIRAADDELGFALAQFGAAATQPYGDAVAAARARLTEAFRLTQALDDAEADTDAERRQWSLQVIALCEQAEDLLAAQDQSFSQLRALEVNAASTLRDVRSRVNATRERLTPARTTLTGLNADFGPGSVSAVAGNVEAAEKLLGEASGAADAAEPGISQAGVSSVSTTLQQAAQSVHRAAALLDAVDRTARDLAAADAALHKLRADTRADLAEAARERDAAPDAATGRAIIDAMAAVDAALAEPAGAANPVAELDRIAAAVADLDLALAGARNQAQRLVHAKAAYEGTLVSARSQIAVARDVIGSRGGSAAARTRLAEAERQLMIAEAETDPVEALDAIRRAVMHARDADALAR